jgi:hypothetical protein
MRKKRHLARLDEVTIERDGDTAVVRYHDPEIPTTALTIGPKLSTLTDADVLALFNDMLRQQAANAAAYKHVAIETPLGSPQIRRMGDQWVARGDVLRCQVLDDTEGQLVVEIDDRELTLEEFGRMLVTHAGWGMRIEFVPDDAVHRRPALQVREPASE